jgi:cyclase
MVKGCRFDSWRSVGLAAQAMRVHAMRGVDEICLLDIGATPEGRGPDLDLVRELSEVVFVPLSVGGGIKNANDAKAVLRAGADKVVVGKAGPDAIAEISAQLGNQAVVAALDVPRPYDMRAIVNRAQFLQAKGAGEILLTSMDREGTLGGYDLSLIRWVSHSVTIPVIAHGGCGTYEDMVEAVRNGANAVASGAMFAFTDCTPRGAVEYLAAHGIETRIPA